MKRLLLLMGASFVFVIFLVGLQTGHAQSGQPPTWNNGIGHRTWSIGLEPEDEKKILSFWNSIGEDLKNETNELAGTYVKGGYDSGYFLRWSVSKGFVVIPYFDQNLITDYGYGKVTFVENSRVIFTPEKELKGGQGLGKMPREWTAIFEYFAPVEELKDFGEYRAGLGQYNEFNGQCCDFVPDFLCARIDGPVKPVSYRVPARYEHFFIDPIAGHITSMGKTKTVRNWGYQGELYSQWMERAVLTPVRINVGRRHGVKRNMLFRLVGEPRFERYLQVMAVGSRVSQGYVVQDISSGSKPGFNTDYETDQQKQLPQIKVGTAITTSPVVD